MPIKIEISNEELQKEHEKLLYILHNMRFAQKYWHIHFGSHAKNQKEKWEKKADELLDFYGLTEHNRTQSVQITKEK